MADKSRETLLQEVIDHPEGAQLNGTGPSRCRASPGISIPFVIRTLPTLTPSSPSAVGHPGLLHSQPRLLGTYPLSRYPAHLPNAQGVLRGQHPLAAPAKILVARCAAEFAKPGGPDMNRIVEISAEYGTHFVEASTEAKPGQVSHGKRVQH